MNARSNSGPSAAYVGPTYRDTLLPGTGIFPVAAVWVPACSDCAALVLNKEQHDSWHAQLWVVVGGSALPSGRARS